MVEDKSFWLSIQNQDYDVPDGYSATSLLSALLPALGSSDPELRDTLSYSILARWIERGLYTPAELRSLARRMEEQLTVGLGEYETDTVFLRSFSVLILACVLEYDNEHPFLTEEEIRSCLEAALLYFRAEQDRRGYVPGKGWAHAIAHAADLLLTLAQNRYMQRADLIRILTAIADLITEPIPFVYLYREDERLAYAVMGILRRDLLNGEDLKLWLRRLAQPPGLEFSWTQEYTSEERVSAFHNTQTFLRSLYFQLTLVERPPAIAQALVYELVQILREMDTGFYELS
ncbi:uncharacterized protein DUF2785 [Thermosporothrix hazakensis]|jgi:hypothetical protein|uniref:Uncharacterized protein DUF2785 n=1 Tax=Thermosporothrix hazakensis TaxID=644383 RepID=A0A326U113_THEHA|nr:DUF2785 domain-containing protein [Thermosporothrix hazakensis]PZW23303.1 uncharacterized protein DUF2785 [Thermosporothrix hazakensis]GCE47770.1 membrane protein [Thermosporothrix hazakensis]